MNPLYSQDLTLPIHPEPEQTSTAGTQNQNPEDNDQQKLPQRRGAAGDVSLPKRFSCSGLGKHWVTN